MAEMAVLVEERWGHTGFGEPLARNKSPGLLWDEVSALRSVTFPLPEAFAIPGI